MDLPQFEIQTLEHESLYSYGQKERACAFAMALWCASLQPDRRHFVLTEPPDLKER